MIDHRLNVLVSAYACHPAPTVEAFPGEAILGWHYVKQISQSHNVQVMTRSFNRPALEERLRNKEIEGIVFHYLDLPDWLNRAMRHQHYGVRLYYFFWQVLAGRYARHLHRTEKFDLFHQVTFSNDWMPSFAGPALPIPFIWGPIGGGQRVPKPLMRILSARERHRERMRVALQRVWRATPFRKKCARNAAAILVCNRETGENFRGQEAKIWQFPVNGISSGHLSPAPTVLSTEEKPRLTILYAGRLDGIKGLPLGLQAFSWHLETYPDSSLEIVGEGPELVPLQRLAKSLKVEDKVRFVPWLPREEVIRRMTTCDVFLFPSLRDGGGAVVVEAMASGRPVICLDVGGPGFHVQPEWGIKIAPREPKAVSADMAKALNMLSSDGEMRLRLGQAARRRAEEYYLWERLGERTQQIYSSVLDAWERY